jgi:hypothetical protein
MKRDASSLCTKPEVKRLKKLVQVGYLLSCFLLISGCTTTEKHLGGTHLLADGTVKVERDARNRLNLKPTINLVNAGDTTCSSVTITLIWPPALEAKIDSGTWTGVTQPVVPGSLSRYEGAYILDASVTDGFLREQAPIEGRIQCTDPAYENKIKLALIF